MEEFIDKYFVTLKDIENIVEKEVLIPYKIARRILDDVILSFNLVKACNGNYVDINKTDLIDLRKYGIKEKIIPNNYCKYNFRCIHQEVLETSNFNKIKICKFY